MIKKKLNTQNVVIIILSILLIVSITFGFTYSFYNGKTNLVKGTITTANLSIELHDEIGKTTEFSISAPFGEDDFVMPGSNLNNVELKLFNKSSRATYMVILYSLSAVKIDTGEIIDSHLGNTPAIAFRENAIDTSVWNAINYKCENTNKTYACLVGINPFAGRSEGSGYYINVLPTNSIKIPKEWGPILMGCNVTISVMAYAIQAEGLDPEYHNPINDANTAGDVDAKSQAIAKAVLQNCGVDVINNEK